MTPARLEAATRAYFTGYRDGPIRRAARFRRRMSRLAARSSRETLCGWLALSPRNYRRAA